MTSQEMPTIVSVSIVIINIIIISKGIVRIVVMSLSPTDITKICPSSAKLVGV
jgi:hypothetical protein